MIEEKVAAAVVVTEVSAVWGVPAVVVRVEIAIPLMLTNSVFHELAPFMVFIARYKMGFCLNQYPPWGELVGGWLHNRVGMGQCEKRWRRSLKLKLSWQPGK